jgi:hypothetical protein
LLLLNAVAACTRDVGGVASIDPIFLAEENFGFYFLHESCNFWVGLDLDVAFLWLKSLMLASLGFF